MAKSTVSPKYQIAIPKQVRQRLRLTPGQKVEFFVYLDRMELIPVLPLKEMRGFLKGIDTHIEREDDRV